MNQRPLLPLFAAVVALWAVLLLPNYALTEFAHEEGRRVLTAAEMMETGDWIQPSIWGRPYLTKPPFMFWAVAACSAFEGEVTTWSARLPSMLATLGSALLLCWLGTRHGSRWTGLLAAAVFLATPMVTEKGTLAETDAVLSFCSFAALVLAWIGWRGARIALVGATLALTCAVLTKGPAALLFYFAGPVGLLFVNWRRALTLLRISLIPCIGSLLLASIWLYLLLDVMDSNALKETWSHEVQRGGAHTLQLYLNEMPTFLSRSLLGFVPASLIWICSGAARTKADGERTELEQLALASVVVGYLFFLFFPGTRARYALPLMPWLALSAGFVLSSSIQPNAPRAARMALGALVWTTGLVGVAAGAAVLASLFGVRVEGVEVGAGGLALVAALAGAGVAAWVAWRRGALGSALLAALSVFFFARGFYVVSVVPSRATHYGFEAKAAELDAAIPSGARVYSDNWGEFNLMTYFHHPVVFTETPFETVPVGDVLLVEAAWFGEQSPEQDLEEWETLRRIEARRGRELVVLRRVASSH